MLTLGILLAALDLWLWRFLLAGSGRLADDAICTGSTVRSGARYGRPFWNGTATVARSLSSTPRSFARPGRCTFTSWTIRLILAISTTIRRRVRRIMQGGII